MGKKQNYETVRLNMNLPKKLVDRLKLYSKSVGMPLNHTVNYMVSLVLKEWYKDEKNKSLSDN